MGRATRPNGAFDNNYFTLYAGFPSTKKQGLKLAFGVRAGASTVRNRAKRLARETFRLNRYKLPGGIEIVITAKRGIGALSRRDIRNQILDLLEQARRRLPSSPPEAAQADDTSKHC